MGGRIRELVDRVVQTVVEKIRSAVTPAPALVPVPIPARRARR